MGGELKRVYGNNINSGNYKNSNSSEINTLLALEKVKKTKRTEKIEKVKNIEKKADIKYPHKTGLQNIGQTSYMNSTIQCLIYFKLNIK